ncbi:MAG: hypothetical protein PHE43_02995 [Candidatus Nanoarchaeia archaeon]|nr:hypothetical protein [Candidatus Nanoarchaeia archaeon]
MDHHAEKSINKLDRTDTNVCVSGTVIVKNHEFFVIDDGTGQIQINFNQEFSGDYVRVFGRLIPYEEGMQVNALIVQDFNKIDKVLYNKIKEIIK